MTAQIISGKKISKEIKAELKVEVDELKAKHNVVPGLSVIIVGEDPASQVYVKNKRLTCEKLGIKSFSYDLPEDTSEDKLLGLIDELNRNDEVHGILVQLPLPKHIDDEKVLLAIDPAKDVDGFHPMNVGRLVTGAPAYLPCTPHGCIQLLKRSGIETSGAEVVVVGRSNIVGKPVANMLIQKAEGANATVTICHTRTKDVAFHTKRADILIAAAGVPKYIKADMVKPGAVVIDVGIHRTDDGLCGDVDDAVKEVASHITPVPGGVGPMTITMLMMNTIRSAKVHNNLV